MDTRHDNAWQDAAEELKAAKAAKAEADARYRAALDNASLVAPDGAKGFGVTMTQVSRKGSIAYAKAIKALLPGLPAEELEPFRGKDSFSYRVACDD